MHIISYYKHLTVNSFVSTNQTKTICKGKTYTLPGGKPVSTSGIYTDTLSSNSSSDTIIITNLTVTTTIPVLQNASICSGKSYILPNGNSVSSTGLHSDTLISAYGCDNIINTNLTVIPPITTIHYQTLPCRSTYTLPGGTIVDSSGIYVTKLSAFNGCDSLITTKKKSVFSSHFSRRGIR